jgi:hypothetical protein
MNFRKALLSAAILLLVFCAACGPRDGAQPRGTATGGLVSEEARLLALLPDSNEVAGWTRGEARFFVEENLYDLINGAMENFMIYGFQRVVTVDYDNPDYPEQIVVELYHMADPRNAFGVYASERNPRATFMQIGAEGYVGGMALNFWSGNYYVKMVTFQDSEELEQAMVALAEAISRKIGATTANAIPELALFPTENQVPHTARFLAQDLLGQSFFERGFSATYRDGNNESQLVIVLTGNEAAAQEAMDRYKAFIESSGTVDREVTEPANGGFVGTDSFHGTMAAIRSGDRIFISLGEASADRALAKITATIG